ncbi:CHAT domain-containing protein [Pseudanabaena sp. FACHB-2040]|uniref:CHAT domain-containing protein n=1 Tax=Pseudanabaena sp. FACHB-2040 TaxID=2692859 RepID=UPI00168201C0|nr:CHAT domain-containing protein [Pseudanabaena sp. FACHB-2040]MBD2256836.1 CHAT domain-containing protein [Pseudanabaena sp. FACHB-2040]
MFQRWPRRTAALLFLSSLILTLWLGLAPLPGFSQVSRSTAVPGQLVQSGVAAYQSGDYAMAIRHWQAALAAFPVGIALAEQATVQENLARAYQQIGQTPEALNYWEKATAAHRQLGNLAQVSHTLTEQAQVYTSLGQHRRAIALLCLPQGEAGSAMDCAANTALSLAQAAADPVGQAAALGSLGEAYRLRGDYEQALKVLQTGLALVQAHGLDQYQASMLSGLGNTYIRLAQASYRRAASSESLGIIEFAQTLQAQAQAQEAQALTYLQQGLEVARQRQDAGAEVRSHLSLLPLYQRQQRSAEADTSRQRLGQLIGQLPPSRETAYAAITLAKSYQPSRATLNCVPGVHQAEAQRWLEQAQAIAIRIDDDRAASFALGELGHLSQCRGDLPTALSFTQQALWAADQALVSTDSTYLWQWQLGRIYRAQGQQAQALAAYQEAIATLEVIRNDILIADQELQFDFRDTVAPIYRELIALQLEPEGAIALPKQATSVNLEAALTTADSLKLAELQSYFGSDCVIAPISQTRVDQVSASSATTVISSIILPERTALIARFPDGSQQLAWVDDSSLLQKTVVDFRIRLQRYRDPAFDSSSSQQLYAWLIQPFESALQASGTTTLVFVQDGVLRSVPMAALYDGQHYLIERYAVATTPSLTLTDFRPLREENLQALALGLSQSITTADGQSFIPLRNVPTEINTVLTQFPGSQALLNGEFSRERLGQTLAQRPFPLLHVATHGQFGGDPKDTFIVTGKGEKLTFGELERLIRGSSPNAEPLELISLTACETAVGDDRSTLGLAGVAIRAGARSAIASLWTIDDATTAQLVSGFYTGLIKPELNKAQALQAAQKAVIAAGGDGAHPAYWAPLIVVGNWL